MLCSKTYWSVYWQQVVGLCRLWQLPQLWRTSQIINNPFLSKSCIPLVSALAWIYLHNMHILVKPCDWPKLFLQFGKIQSIVASLFWTAASGVATLSYIFSQQMFVCVSLVLVNDSFTDIKMNCILILTDYFKLWMGEGGLVCFFVFLFFCLSQIKTFALILKPNGWFKDQPPGNPALVQDNI